MYPVEEHIKRNVTGLTEIRRHREFPKAETRTRDEMRGRTKLIHVTMACVFKINHNLKRELLTDGRLPPATTKGTNLNVIYLTTVALSQKS